MLRAGLILLICLIAAGCHVSTSGESRSPVKVRLAYATQHDCALVHIAVARGFFRDEAVEIEPLLLSFGKQALDTVLQGKADLATVAETPFMLAVLRGEKVSAIATIFTSDRNHAILVRRASGVSKPEELAGKRVGCTLGTTSDVFLSSFLTAHHISPQQVTAVPMRPDEMLDALRDGRVDAVSTWNPPLKQMARELGQDGFLLEDPSIYTEKFLLTGRPAYLDEHKEAVTRVLRALLKAEQFAYSHPEEARAMIAAPLNIAPDLLRELWGAGRFRVTLDHSLLISLEEETRWAIKRRLAGNAQMPNYLEHLDFFPLWSLKPGAIDVNQVVAHEIRR